jgi:hypothetical protein
VVDSGVWPDRYMIDSGGWKQRRLYTAHTRGSSVTRRGGPLKDANRAPFTPRAPCVPVLQVGWGAFLDDAVPGRVR